MIRALELLGAVSRAESAQSLSRDCCISPEPVSAASTPLSPPPPPLARSPYFTPPRSGPTTRRFEREEEPKRRHPAGHSQMVYPPTPSSPVRLTTTTRLAGSEAARRRSTRTRGKPGSRTNKRKEKGHALGMRQGGDEAVVAKSEEGYVEAIDKIHLIQERVRHDPWKMLVATCLLNVTSGRAARPIYIELLRRYPTPEALSQASIPDLVELLYPLGLFNQRAASLVRFSQEYLAHQWPIHPGTPSPDPSLHPTAPFAVPPASLPGTLDVSVFHGAGRYASDSFRIYSDLLPGKGGPEREERWADKRKRALARCVGAQKGGVGRGHLPGENGAEAEGAGADTEGKAAQWDAERVGEYLSDEEPVEEEEWRKVRPTGGDHSIAKLIAILRRHFADVSDKELRRYLIWRWGLEGIVYDIHHGPKIKRKQDMQRLAYLC